MNPSGSVYRPRQPFQASAYHPARSEEGYQHEKYPEYVPLEDFQAKPSVKVPPLAHSSSKMLGGKRGHISEKIKEMKFDDEDDLLSENFNTGFDDDLEAILGANFVGMVTLLPAEFEKKTQALGNSEDCFDVFPGQECFFFGSDEDESVLFERPDEVMRSHLRPLHIKIDIDGKLINRVLVNGGATINLLPEAMLAKFGKTVE